MLQHGAGDYQSYVLQLRHIGFYDYCIIVFLDYCSRMSWCIENLYDCQAWADSGLKLSTTSNEAAKLYDCAVRQYVSWIDVDQAGGIENTIANMMRNDPDFVMGKALECSLELMGTGRTARLDPKFRESIESLVQVSSTSSLTPREKFHVKAVEQVSNDELREACDTWETILKEYPQDVLALKLAHDMYFYLGNQKEIRDSVARVLPHWKPHMPLYSYLKGMLSFGLEENNQFSEAEKAGLEALEMNKQDAWATHALAHVYEMEVRYKEGIHFLSTTVKDWSACNMLACHNFWHWGLYQIEKGDTEEALSLFDREIGKRMESGALLDIVDATSFLYRLQFQEITAKYGVPLFKAMAAYRDGDFRATVDLLHPISDHLVLIGGSNAQRDIFAQLLIFACLKSDAQAHKTLAKDLIMARQKLKPGSPLTERMACHLRTLNL